MRRVGRVAWSSVDQGLSSASNLLLSVLIAQVASIEEFGVFGIAFAIYQIGLGSSRAFLGEPLLVTAPKKIVRAHASSFVGASIVPGSIGALVCGVIAVASGDPSSILGTVAVGFPALMAADAIRYWYFSEGKPARAAGIDTVWLVVQLSSYFALMAFGVASVQTVLVTWLFGAFAALLAFFAAELRGQLPNVRAGLHWIGQTRHLSFRFWGEYLTIAATQQSLLFFSVMFAGLVASAGIRGAQVLIGPLSMISMGVAVVALPYLAKRVNSLSGRALILRALLISMGLALVTSLYAGLLLLLPDGVGFALLGDSWSTGSDLAPLLILLTLVSNLSYGATAVLRSLELARLTFRLRLITLPVAIGAILIGASISPAAAITGAISGATVQLICWWSTVVYISYRRGQSNER